MCCSIIEKILTSKAIHNRGEIVRLCGWLFYNRKDTNFESNPQRATQDTTMTKSCSIIEKILTSKAIHNSLCRQQPTAKVVL